MDNWIPWDISDEPILEHPKGRQIYQWYCISKQKETGKLYYDIIEAPSLIGARDKMHYIWGRGFIEELCILRADVKNMIEEENKWFSGH